ncbi:MAG: dienelactone hydrolase family protein [Caulobacteraceae bacterium]
MTSLHRPEGPAASDLRPSRRALAGLAFAGWAAAGLSAAAEPIVTDASGLITGMVTFPGTGGFALPAYFARPAGRIRRPAVLVISEVFGLHAYIEDVCRRLAKLGYVAFAPAFFVRVADPAPLTDLKAVVDIVKQASDTQVMGDVAGALRWLKSRPFVDASAVAVTGFCWGGGVTWLACEQFTDFRCGVAWYGRMVPSDPADEAEHLWPSLGAAHLHGPVLGLYGGLDPLAAQIPAMRAALIAAGKSDSQIVVYPDAGHGFHADYRASYNAADARDGWARMLAFFAAHGVAPRALTAR